MAKKLDIDNTLVRCDSEGLPDNMVGVAVLVRKSDGYAEHAAVFVRYNGESKLLHFAGYANQVEFDDIDSDEWYFHKNLTIIDPLLLPSIMLHCDVVKNEARPRFGFFYAGSMYDDKGDFISPGNLPEYMTCVGFCLNFIKYLLKGRDFFQYDDWDSTSVTVSDDILDGYIEERLEKILKLNPELDREHVRKGFRRIYPLEYLVGGYSEKIPVRKKFVDQHKASIGSAVQLKIIA